MSDEIGEFFENPGEMHYEWRISNFMSLPEDVNRFYLSPKFYFSDACWCWKIYPHYTSAKTSEKSIGLYLSRLDSGPQKTILIEVGIKKYNGQEEIFWCEYGNGLTFGIRDRPTLGRAKFLQKSQLLSRNSELAPSGTLTLTCSLKSGAQNSSEGSLFSRLWNMSCSFKNILTTRKKTDVVLKMRGGKIPAHKMILESRSEVFNSMFSVDMRESKTGEVNVKDAHVDAFKVVLSYVYSGEPEGLSSENVYEVYKIAHKYDFQGLRKLCAEVIQDCLSMDTVCDAIALADLYDEKKLRENAKKYFAKHRTVIFETKNWKRFKRENPETGCEVLECVLGENVLENPEMHSFPSTFYHDLAEVLL